MKRNELRKLMQESVPNMTYVMDGTKNNEYINSTYRWAMRKDISTLYGAYRDPSIYKMRAFNYCRDLCRAYNGYNFRISGYNSQTFSVTFMFVHPETGVVCIAWITKDYNRFTEYHGETVSQVA